MYQPIQQNYIKQTLSKQIEQGKYIPGQRLPSLTELANEFNTTEETVLLALKSLQTAKLIDIFPKHSFFVRNQSTEQIRNALHSFPVPAGFELKSASSFVQVMKELGRKITIKYIQPSRLEVAGPELATKLLIDESIDLYKRYRVQLVDDIPYRILKSYYLGALFEELVGKDEEYFPLFKWLKENKGFYPTRALEKLNCRQPTEAEQQLLQIPGDQPVIEMERWLWASSKPDDKSSELLFEYSVIVSNPQLLHFSYSYDIDREASS